MVHGKNRIPYRIDRRLTGLAGPDYDAPISFGLPLEPEDSQYGKSRLNKVDAALVFVYFLGDATVPRRNPVTREGWEAAIGLATHHLGVSTNSRWIRENVADVFIDVNDLRHVPWP